MVDAGWKLKLLANGRLSLARLQCESGKIPQISTHSRANSLSVQASTCSNHNSSLSISNVIFAAMTPPGHCSLHVTINSPFFVSEAQRCG